MQPVTINEQLAERPGAPGPRQQAAYRCNRGHDFEVTFAAGAELPPAVDCRCGASAARPGQGSPDPASAAELERRMTQLCQRRSPAELEQLLADRLVEVAAMRKAARS